MIWLSAIKGFARLVPWQAWLVAGALAYFGLWHWKEVREAVATFSASLIAKSNEQGAKADAGALAVNECYAKGEPWRWNREASKCEKP